MYLHILVGLMLAVEKMVLNFWILHVLGGRTGIVCVITPPLPSQVGVRRGLKHRNLICTGLRASM